MALPSNDNEEVLLWKIVVEMKDALSDVTTFRAQVQELKNFLVQVNKEGGASFDAISKSLKIQLKQGLDEAKAGLRELNAELKELQKQARTGVKVDIATGVEQPVNVAEVNRQITEQNRSIEEAKKKVSEANAAWKIYQDTASQALKEVRRESDLVAQGYTDLGRTATEAGQQATTSFAGADEGVSDFATSVTTSAAQIAQSYQQAGGGVKNFGTLVDSLKTKMIEIQQQTGRSFKDIATQFNLTFREQGAKAALELRNQITATTQQIKVLQQTLASPPSNATQEQLRLVRQDLSTLQTRLPQLKAELNSTQQSFSNMGIGARQAASELQNTGRSVNILGIQISGLGDIARLVFLGLFGGSLLAVFGRFASQIREATEAGFELAKAIFQLEIGIRALRRAGINITFEEFTENLQRLKEEFVVFSTKDLLVGSAAFVNLVRDMRFTKDEIFELQRAIATLAVVNGRAMDDVQRTVALALSSGYTEGLQRLGISINRVTIAAKAMELGFEGGYNALTEGQRAEATRLLILQKTANYLNDVSEFQNTLTGQLEETNKAIEDQTALIGEDLLPTQLSWRKAVLGIVTAYRRLSGGLEIVRVLAGGFDVGSIAVTQTSRSINLFTASVLKLLPKPVLDRLDDFYDKIVKVGDAIGENLISQITSLIDIFPGLENGINAFLGIDFKEIEQTFTIQPRVGNLEDLPEEVIDVLEEANEEILELQKEYDERLLELEEEYNNDKAKLRQKGLEKLKDIEEDFNEDIVKINERFFQRVLELQQRLQERLSNIDLRLEFNLNELQIRFDFDVQETIIKFNEDVAKANRDFRQKEIDRERDYTEQLLQIREDYLITLEDALEERDARAVLRARREFNLERDRAERENDLNKTKNKEDLAEDLRAAAERRDARIRELKFELEQRRAELQRQAEFDREEAQRRYQQDLDNLRENLRRELEARQEAREQEEREAKAQAVKDRIRLALERKRAIVELENYFDNQVAVITQKLQDVADATGIAYEIMAEALTAFVGEGGIARQIISSFAAFIEETMRGLERLRDKYDGFRPTPANSAPRPGFAKGGAAVFDSPTTIDVAEREPELALFVPLSQIDTVSGLFESGVGDRVSSGPSGETRVRIGLEPGLVGEIVDESVGQAAEVVFEHNRMRS